MTVDVTWKPLLQQRQRERDALITSIAAALRVDERVVAVWLAGSLGRRDADAVSDIDLWIVVTDDASDAIGAAPRRFVAGIVAPSLVIDAPQNAPPNGAYLFTHIPGDTGAHQVDWYWQAATDAARPATTKLLFERWPIPLESAPAPLDHDALVAQLSAAHAEFWAVVHIAVKAIVRGDHRAVHRNVEYLETFTRTLRWLIDHGSPPTFDALRKTTRAAPLPRTMSDRFQLLDTFIAQVETMEPELVRLGVPLSAAAKAQVLRWVNLVRVTAE